MGLVFLLGESIVKIIKGANCKFAPFLSSEIKELMVFHIYVAVILQIV